MAQYALSEYWDGRYHQDCDEFDWYQNWEGLKDLILPHIYNAEDMEREDKSLDILMVGAGTSDMTENVYKEGFKKITNVDFSETCIKWMTGKFQDMDPPIPEPKWVVDDIRTLDHDKFVDCSFDVIISKGTVDSVLVSENAREDIEAMCNEVSRCLKPGGRFIVVSQGFPDHRMPYLDNQQKYQWTLKKTETILKRSGVNDPAKDPSSVHWMYVFEMTKAKVLNKKTKSHAKAKTGMDAFNTVMTRKEL
jgi:ubiquinone/menaquinone biosynthesis C-methylase UbiE